jgi:hypothetical protein
VTEKQRQVSHCELEETEQKDNLCGDIGMKLVVPRLLVNCQARLRRKHIFISLIYFSSRHPAGSISQRCLGLCFVLKVISVVHKQSYVPINEINPDFPCLL